MKEFLKIYVIVMSILHPFVIYIILDSEFTKINNRLDKLEHPKPQPKPTNTFGELNDIKPEHRALVMAIAMTESNCNYNVKHPDKDTKGIGGIKENMWTLKSNINSLKAIEEVVEVLESRGLNEWEVIRAYKGGITNLKSTQQCWDLYKRLVRII